MDNSKSGQMEELVQRKVIYPLDGSIQSLSNEGQATVSRKSRGLFRPGKPVVKLQSAGVQKLIF